MAEWLNSFVLSFVPLFIVIDVLGTVPFVIALSEGMTGRERRKMIHVAAITAVVVGLAFLFFGKFILNIMGISVGAFSVAGGIILFILSIKYLLTGHFIDAVKEEMVAVVPIGTPLLVGPATITTLLFLVGVHSVWVVLTAFLVNLLIAWIVMLLANQIVRFLGKGGVKAVSNIFNLLLAAIAVTMVFRGLELLGLITIP